MRSHTPVMELEAEVYDKDGNLKDVYRQVPECRITNDFPDDTIEMSVYSDKGVQVSHTTFPCRTFMKNWFEMIYHNCIGNSIGATIIGTSGTVLGGRLTDVVQVDSAAGTTTYGIQVGSSGSTSQTLNEFKLGTVIAHGSSSGSLDYGATVVGSMLASGSSYTYPIRRFFMNLSSGSVNIKEVGLVGRLANDASYPALVSRDIVDYSGTPINVTVNPAQSLEVVYKFYCSPGNGFTRNGLAAPRGAFSQTTTSVANVTNTITVALLDNSCFRNIPAAEVTTHGIVLGSGSTPMTVLDYKLAGQYQHGVTANTLWYYAQETLAPTDDGIDNYFISQRAFGNDSGGTIPINEVGLITLKNTDTSYWLMSRLVISTINLLSLESIRIRLKWRLLNS